MSELTYKKIIDVEQVEALNDAATVFINDNGAMKQVGADKFGAVKTVNGIEPDENGDIVVEVPEAVTDDHINGLIDEKMANAGGWDAVIEWEVDGDVSKLPADDAISEFKDSAGLYDKLMPIIQAGDKPKILLRGERHGNTAVFIEPFLVNASDSDEDGANDRIYIYVFEEGMQGIKARYIIIAPSGITAVGTSPVV